MKLTFDRFIFVIARRKNAGGQQPRLAYIEYLPSALQLYAGYLKYCHSPPTDRAFLVDEIVHTRLEIMRSLVVVDDLVFLVKMNCREWLHLRFDIKFILIRLKL